MLAVVGRRAAQLAARPRPAHRGHRHARLRAGVDALEEDAGALGNRITQVVVPLPIYLADPLERLRVVSEAMRDVKDSKLAAGAEMIAGMQDFAPPTLLAQASRLNFSGRFFNLLVTNVPGPQFPLYLLGRRDCARCSRWRSWPATARWRSP